ncbi:MAG: hypothetical protein AAB851_02040 [Patescibacteria group bacterium]
MDWHVILVTIHIIGVALGVGGATVSDFLFFKSIKDGKIEAKEFDFMKAASKIVWTGFVVLVFSGVSMFIYERLEMAGPEEMYNPGIWAHIIAALVIFFNGLAMHWKVFPAFESSLGVPFGRAEQILKSRKIIFTTGAISIVSWYFALILGATRGFGLPFSWILAFYAFAVIGAVVVANIVGGYVIKKFTV